jgi:hypothetical protein
MTTLFLLYFEKEMGGDCYVKKLVCLACDKPLLNLSHGLMESSWRYLIAHRDAGDCIKNRKSRKPIKIENGCLCGKSGCPLWGDFTSSVNS